LYCENCVYGYERRTAGYFASGVREGKRREKGVGAEFSSGVELGGLWQVGQLRSLCGE
jgi:hypothetical protein